MGKLILVQDIDPSVTEVALREVLDAYGTVLEMSLVDDADAEVPAKTAFVSFRNGREGRAAIAGMDGSELAGKTLKVKALRGRERMGQGGSRGAGDSGKGAGRGRLGGAGGFGAGSGAHGRKGLGKAGGRNR